MQEFVAEQVAELAILTGRDGEERVAFAFGYDLLGVRQLDTEWHSELIVGEQNGFVPVIGKAAETALLPQIKGRSSMERMNNRHDLARRT